MDDREKDNAENRTCTKCGSTKHIDEFPHFSKIDDHHRSWWCKDCFCHVGWVHRQARRRNAFKRLKRMRLKKKG